MAKAADVLTMLCPEAKWVTVGSEYENIQWLDGEPAITKKEYLAGFDQYDAWKAQQEADKVLAKEALLERLGITLEEAELLTRSL